MSRRFFRIVAVDFRFRAQVVRDAIAAADRLEDEIVGELEGDRREKVRDALEAVREVLFFAAADLRGTKPFSAAEIGRLLEDAHANLREAATGLRAYDGDQAARAELDAMYEAEHVKFRQQLRDLADELGRLAEEPEPQDEP